MASPEQKLDLEDQLPFCFPELCERLTCREALPIRGLCRGACETFGPLALAAAAFAASRPLTHYCRDRDVLGSPGSLAMWMKTWQACAQVSEAKGQSAGMWARSCEPRHPYFPCTEELEPRLVAEGETCLGVLAVVRSARLLLLADGSFLLCRLVDECEVRFHRARTLAELAPLWDLGEDGALRRWPWATSDPAELGGLQLCPLEGRVAPVEMPIQLEPVVTAQMMLNEDTMAGLLVRGSPAPPAGAPGAVLPRGPEPSGAATSCREEGCYQEVVHWESAAEIPPEEAQAISRQLWAGHVQCLAGLLRGQPASSQGVDARDLASEDSAPRQPATELWDTVFLVGLSRVCDALRAALHKGRELEPVRAAAAAAGHSVLYASGAAVFLYPEQYPRVQEALREEQLRPHHVLIVEAFLPLLYHEILRLPSRADVRPCSRRPHMLVQEDGSIVAAVEKTFIRAPASARRRPESVVQSLRGRREGENPRRRVP